MDENNTLKQVMTFLDEMDTFMESNASKTLLNKYQEMRRNNPLVEKFPDLTYQ